MALRGKTEKIERCTSPIWRGLLSLPGDPSKSWVAKFNRLDTYVPGVYALHVTGKLPKDVLTKMAELKIAYIPSEPRSSFLFPLIILSYGPP